MLVAGGKKKKKKIAELWRGIFFQPQQKKKKNFSLSFLPPSFLSSSSPKDLIPSRILASLQVACNDNELSFSPILVLIDVRCLPCCDGVGKRRSSLNEIKFVGFPHFLLCLALPNFLFFFHYITHVSYRS